MPNYQIRKKGSEIYSNGIITRSSFSQKLSVTWSAKGKTWKTEKAVKDHLLKYIKKVGPINDFEIVEVVLSPTKPIEDWVNPKMLMEILKS